MSESTPPESRPSRRGFFDRLLGRQHYRVRGPFLRRFRCSIREEEGSNVLHPVDLDDCSLGGAAFCVPPGGNAQPAFNTHCLLRFDDELSSQGYDVLAYVRRAGFEDGVWKVAVSFVDFEELVPRLRGDWWRIFNRRRVLRTVFDASEGARARLLGPDLSSDAAVVDLSMDGVGLELPIELRERLEETVACFVQLGGIANLELRSALAASTRHVGEGSADGPTAGAGKSEEPRTVRFGLSWKPDRSRDWDAARASIARLVDERDRRGRVLV